MKKIVVGISGAETSQAAARQAVELAAVFGASVHFVTAVSNDEREVVQGAGTDRWEYSTLEVAKAQIADFVRSLGLELEHTVVALEGPPAKMLIAQAENIGA
ncbi:MAG: universal stress protein, partial [Ilumatobacteraceae bacterium]